MGQENTITTGVSWKRRPSKRAEIGSESLRSKTGHTLRSRMGRQCVQYTGTRPVFLERNVCGNKVFFWKSRVGRLTSSSAGNWFIALKDGHEKRIFERKLLQKLPELNTPAYMGQFAAAIFSLFGKVMFYMFNISAV